MKKNHHPISIFLLVGIFFIFSNTGISQNVEFTKANFPSQKSELSKALKNLKSGDALFDKNTRGAYAEALNFYLEANHFNPKNAGLSYKMGVCYIMSYDKSLSLQYLEQAKSLDSNVSKQLCLYLGMAYQFQSRFAEAIKCFQHYEATLSPKEKDREAPIVEKHISECEAGLKLKANPNIIKFDKLTEKVNSIWDEYCPVIDAQESIMAFTSRRKSSVGERINPLDGLYFEDIYFTFKDYSSAWDYPENPGAPLNGKANDATVEISADGNILTLYKNIKGKDYICESSKQGGKWTKPEKLAAEINRTQYHQPSAAYTRDRKTIYYVSDQKGGYGGTDIYYSQILPDGTWTPSKNLGPEVNSPYDEEAPFLFADSTLYYSSRGFNTMGGYDVFVTKLRKDGNWSKPANMGVPLNSPGDDLYLVVSPSGESYISSDRINGYGGFDIYHIKILSLIHISEPTRPY
jgi:tetratricopeptide (TPR) repeat protein